ncbi:MAG: flagellar brake domain-containing protein [Lachnospiraceae bacterium]|nr:flagellar brake domain-containing protein [Lachnospiraceae bacterium]
MAEDNADVTLSYGDKITIIITQEYAQEQNGGDKARRYLSQVHDIKADGTIVMEMPMIQRRLVALSTGLRYTFIFTIEKNDEKAFYIAQGELVSRYREGNFFLMDARLSTPLKHFQRREFYRLDCSLRSIGVALGGDDFDPKHIIDASQFLLEHIEDGYQVAHGIISNISGGGALLITDYDFKDTSYILLRVIFKDEATKAEEKKNKDDVFDRKLEDHDDTMELLAKILEKKYNDSSEKYSYRLMFVFKNPRFRERIIRYVFDEQRKQRKKEQGSR